MPVDPTPRLRPIYQLHGDIFLGVSERQKLTFCTPADIGNRKLERL
jgi:hypothetical protein